MQENHEELFLNMIITSVIDLKQNLLIIQDSICHLLKKGFTDLPK